MFVDNRKAKIGTDFDFSNLLLIGLIKELKSRLAKFRHLVFH